MKQAQKYRKKPVVIEAVEYTGHNDFEIGRWSNGAVYSSPVLEPTEANPTGSYLQIKTLEGVMTAIVGDFIIKGVAGEFYPCKPDIFEKTYEEEEPHTTEQPDLPAPNTVMWWLCRIADPEIRRKAVNTFDKFPLYEDSKEAKDIINIDEAIDSIAWYDEANGLGAYFESLHRTQIPLLPEPDFTEYNELRK